MNTGICMGCFEPMNGFDVCSHCGWHAQAVPEHAYHLKQGTVLRGRYIVGNSVGVGGFGITYKAWDTTLNTMVAIKEFYPASLVSRVPGEKDIVVFSGDKKDQFDVAIQRFLEEARNMAKFTGHPNIVNVYEFFEENGTAYIVMEFLDGITVKQLLASTEGGKLDENTAVEITLGVLEALAEMHSKGIIHRDISPDNIQITSKNEIRIFDLGAAKLAKEDKEETRSVVVKTGYTPPEQYRAKSKQGAFTDLYSAGAVLYKLLTGTTPEESVDRIVEDHLEKPSKLGVKVDINLERAIMKSLALKPELRFQNAAQFKDAINNKKMVDFPEDELRKRRKIRIAFAAAISVFAIIFFVFFGNYMSSYLHGEDFLVANDDAITVWIPVSDDPTLAEEQKQIYQGIVADFVENAKQPSEEKPEGNNFEVELVAVPQSEYQDSLVKSLDEGNGPSVFNTDFFGDELPDYAGNLDLLLKSTSERECIIFNEYNEAYPNKCEMPTGTYANVLYVNTEAAKQAGIQIPEKVEDFGALMDSATKTGDIYTVAIAEDNVDDALNAMIEEDLYSYKTGINPAAETAFARIGTGLDNQAFSYAQTAPLQAFKANQLIYYLDDTTELQNFRTYLPGYYQVIPVENNGKLMVSMSKHFGINKNADENEKLVAMQFIRFLMSDYAQDILHVQNKTAMPINPTTLETYVQFNTDIEFVLNYTDDM
ncbi:MAG: extracellular solute-binding protein, partial [Clostridia bacterium]|nr:extracellular solute-binding protein [Clostridia bacterium]